MVSKIKIVVVLFLICVNILVLVLNYDYNKLKSRESELKLINERISLVEDLNLLFEGEINSERLTEIYVQLSKMEKVETEDYEQLQAEVSRRFRSVIDTGWSVAKDIESGTKSDSDPAIRNLEEFNNNKIEFLEFVQAYEKNLNKKIISLRIKNELESI